MTVAPVLVGILVAATIGVVSVPLLIRISHKYSLLDRPGHHKRHKTPVPFLGGVGLFVAMWLSVVVCSLLFPDSYGELGASVGHVFLGAVMIMAVGLADDFAPVSAWVKLAVQVSVGLVLYSAGLRAEFLTTPYGSIEIGAASVIITVLWVVVLTNAINLIDGLDGLASGVSLIAAVTMLVIGWLYEVGWMLVFIYGLIGFLAVFLFYNYYPARIFLGDCGSMQIGYYFAVFSLVVPLKSFTGSALFVPLLALGVPILETTSSFVRRLVSGRNVMRADRRHLFHLLSLAGLSPRQVVLIFYSLGVVFGLFAVAMYAWNRVLVLVFFASFMVVILTLFFIFVSGLSFPNKGDRAAGGGGPTGLRTQRRRDHGR